MWYDRAAFDVPSCVAHSFFLVTPRVLVFNNTAAGSSSLSFDVPKDRLTLAVSMCTPRSARWAQDTYAHCEEITRGVESPRVQVVCLRREVGRLRELLEASERRCRILAEHSDGFWEEEVYDIINNIHRTNHDLQHSDDRNQQATQKSGLSGRLWRLLSCSRFLR